MLQSDVGNHVQCANIGKTLEFRIWSFLLSSSEFWGLEYGLFECLMGYGSAYCNWLWILSYLLVAFTKNSDYHGQR